MAPFCFFKDGFTPNTKTCTFPIHCMVNIELLRPLSVCIDDKLVETHGQMLGIDISTNAFKGNEQITELNKSIYKGTSSHNKLHFNELKLLQ